MPQTIPVTIKLMMMAKEATNHEFWPDSVSLLNPALFNADAFTQHGQITDCYLLALAVKNNGRLLSLDQAIKTATGVGFKLTHLLLI
jgi:uncharacterized protein